jgi:hypothetical protein
VHPYIAEKVSTYGTFAASRVYAGPFLSKDTNYRNAIPVEERLLIYIRLIW